MALIGSLFLANAQQNTQFKVLDVQTFNDSIQQKKIQLIDVRTPQEFNSGHIEGAKNIDFYSKTFNVEFSKLEKEQPVYLYCKSGNRSRLAGNKLMDLGFKQIYDLEGGYLNWSN